MEEEYLLISGIQHFVFCRRQWALIHIEDAWEENQLTAEGRLMHDKVHDADLTTVRNGIVILRGLPVRSDRLMITGVCDAVELIPDDNGISFSGRNGRWKVHPVEYKHGTVKTSDCDRLQLAAECVCLEEMLSCEITDASIYYGGTRHRENVTIDDDLRKQLDHMVSEMWGYYRRKYTPKVKPGKACNSCSLVNICIPKLMKERNVSNYIRAHLVEENA